jgi:uncharacterized protein
MMNQSELWDTPTMRWMQTFTGRAIDIANPKPEDIDIEDIAHSLVRLCRYGGHVVTWYSVAGHSLAMGRFAETLVDQAMLECLLHDAAEAYLGDTISPVRKLLTDEARRASPEEGTNAVSMLERLHERWNSVIARRFGLRDSVATTVHMLDRLALVAEIPLVFSSLSPAFARNGYAVDLQDPMVIKMQSLVLGYVRNRESRPEDLESEFLAAFKRWEKRT